MNQFVFDSNLLNSIREQFYYLEKDYSGRERLFFENAGGSLRLKSAVEAKARMEKIPECPERTNDIAMWLQQVKADGIRDFMQVMLGAHSGAVVSELTASQVMFRIARAIIENVPGTNVVTTSIEHPSAYDSLKIYAEKTGKEFRVALANPTTGGVDTEEILKLIDNNTCLLSVMSASNISGYIFNLEEIAREARKIKPDLFIVTDAVQHLPHSAMDVQKLQLDGVTFAPYKAFGIRGCGFGYVSDRVAVLPHDKLIAKPSSEWELGTFPHPNYASLCAIVNYVCWIGSHFINLEDRRACFLVGMDKIHAHERSLWIRMMEGSDEVPGLRHQVGVKVFLDSNNSIDRDLIVAMGIQAMDMSEAVRQYYKRGVTVYERVNTSLYSKRIVESLGLSGVIRVSPLHCHTLEEIDRFLKVTQDIVASKV